MRALIILFLAAGVLVAQEEPTAGQKPQLKDGKLTDPIWSLTYEAPGLELGMPTGDARSTGRKIMDLILGRKTRAESGGSVAVGGQSRVIRNEARGLKPAIVEMAVPDSEGIDPQSTEALAKPGLDARMTPLVDANDPPFGSRTWAGNHPGASPVPWVKA